MGVHKTRLALMGVSAYRDLLAQSVLARFRALLDALVGQDGEGALAAYCDFFYALRREGYLGLGPWLWDRLRFSESPYGLLLERGGQDPALESAARRDVDAFAQAAALDPDYVLDQLLRLLGDAAQSVVTQLPRWSAGLPFDFDSLAQTYRQRGCGIFAQYRAFRWEEGRLVPVLHPDSPEPWELWGYADQRQQVRENALALLEGRRVNHVLLYGDSGTGKSATVKSLLAQPDLDRLRIIEMDKDRLTDIPALVRQLDGRICSFILFIDDLAFDQDDKTYSQLKTILEGSLEQQRRNVVVYATSNRRNLVRQTFSDRSGDEVDLSETLAEKTSLAERFGVRVCYQSLTPREFLQMVRDLAQTYHLRLPPQELEDQARKWELRHPGRTPRTAKQFLSYQLDRQG